VTFEILMETFEIPKQCWAFKLAPQLLHIQNHGDYMVIKAAILCHYNITKETHRQRLRVAKGRLIKGSNLSNRPSKQWLRKCKTVVELKKLVVPEQMLNILPKFGEKKPRTSSKAGRLVDNYLQARKNW